VHVILKHLEQGSLQHYCWVCKKEYFPVNWDSGTGSIAAVTADTKNPCNNGMVQVFGIHVENLLIATITVLVICMSNYQDLIVNNPNGIEIAIYAFKYHIGSFGPLFIAITITLFGLSSVIASYYYGESSFKFIKNTNRLDIAILKIVTLCVLIIASIASSSFLWASVDAMVGVIAVINIYAIFKLRKIVINEYKYYQENKN